MPVYVIQERTLNSRLVTLNAIYGSLQNAERTCLEYQREGRDVFVAKMVKTNDPEGPLFRMEPVPVERSSAGAQRKLVSVAI